MPLSSWTTVPDDVFSSVCVYERGRLMCFLSFVLGEPSKSKDVLFHLRKIGFYGVYVSDGVAYHRQDHDQCYHVKRFSSKGLSLMRVNAVTNF